MMLSLCGWIALPMAFCVTPLLAVGMVTRNRFTAASMALATVCAAALNTALPALLHWSPWPLSGTTLAGAHLLVAGIFAITMLGGRLATDARLPVWSPAALRMRLKAVCNAANRHLADVGQWPRLAVPVVGVLLAALMFPYTHFTGIDTYKWQDLAVSVYANESIPWIIHPLSLFGFTPRAYPAAQPLMLATIYLLTGLHIRFAFYWLSLWTVTAGLLTARALGQRIFVRPGAPELFAIGYVLAPVFVRYSHWATGRGLFLALFPAFLLVLADVPRRSSAIGLAPVAGVLLTTHKVAWFAAGLACFSALAGRIAQRTGRGARPGRAARLTGRALALGTMLALAAWVTPRWGGAGSLGAAGGLARYGTARMGWLLPAALAASLTGMTGLASDAQRRFMGIGLLAIVLLFEAQMYGALVALPFLTALAGGGAMELACRWRKTGRLFIPGFIALSLMGAVAVVAHRNRMAAPPRLVRAARFLQAHDPAGPFIVNAPGRARVLIQAYQTGSPQFTVSHGEAAAIRCPAPPSWRGPLPHVLREWSVWGRGMLTVTGTATDWYGPNPRTYHVRIDGSGTAPRDARPIYAADGIEVFE